MIPPGEHLSDEQLSGLLDEQLLAAELTLMRAHVDRCATCAARLAEWHTVVRLLSELPQLELPRDFQLPRTARLEVIQEPANVIRLRRWYTATRVAAGSLAAAFVMVSAGTLYVDSRPGAAAGSGTVQRSAAPSVSDSAGSAPAPAAAAARAAQPAEPVQPAPYSSGSPAVAQPPQVAAARPQNALTQPTPAVLESGGDASDQRAAATRVQALPTPIPTVAPPIPTPATTRPASTPAAAPTDAAAPLRTAAVAFALLTVLSLLAAILIRHRLGTASHLAPE